MFQFNHFLIKLKPVVVCLRELDCGQLEFPHFSVKPFIMSSFNVLNGMVAIRVGIMAVACLSTAFPGS